MTNDNPWAGLDKIGALDQKLYEQTGSNATPLPSEAGRNRPAKSGKTHAQEKKAPEIMKTGNHESVSGAGSLAERPEKYSTLLKRSLVKKIKSYAIEMEMSDYEVIDCALAEYFEKHQ